MGERGLRVAEASAYAMPFEAKANGVQVQIRESAWMRRFGSKNPPSDFEAPR